MRDEGMSNPNPHHEKKLEFDNFNIYFLKCRIIWKIFKRPMIQWIGPYLKRVMVAMQLTFAACWVDRVLCFFPNLLYLFILVMESFSCLLDQCTQNQMFKFHPKHEMLRISHVVLADDLLKVCWIILVLRLDWNPICWKVVCLSLVLYLMRTQQFWAELWVWR